MMFLLIVIILVIIITSIFLKSSAHDPDLLYFAQIFGEYTKKIKWDDKKYILYNEETRRILLCDSCYNPKDLNEKIYDTRVLKSLKIEENESRNGVDFGKETVSSTDWNSAVNRGILGGLLFGKVGAAVGVLTADKKKEVRETTIYIKYPADYTIFVYDNNETCIGYYNTTDRAKYLQVRNLLEGIIEFNEFEKKLEAEGEN